ncbi:fumarylacetoacetate hydrolase family protein [Palleronia pelagia]|uniref:2-keto-4-pentenoate hydratase/2-oxohepta-3-ene-1,7-dioic acid hydratase (Catechol pathway) n=1 Tax=Palleronia pelagia TaxID=387096 RepID=A0A1H8AIP8_9RHOB|nr:fumarylacetoacetate hydrolase family protein [Palleronia pelagia]SEM69834.1 2-keto-4-pentenoate hydratase/2-oxohepta-3-ene-1,7-dioic acid hydratase (catechol pathway) [Palleronia pelagia]
MKLVTFEKDGELGAGVLESGTIRICAQGDGAGNAVLDAIRSGQTDDWARRRGPRMAPEDVRLLAPIPDPRGPIYCVGKNYHAHADEFHGSGFDSSSKSALPDHPVIFTKPPSSVVGPEAEVRGSLDPTATVDYEGELGLVIGRPTFGVSGDAVWDHIFGYVIINDVTSRELQRQHGQWTIGKGLDTFCPMGPWLVTADEVGDPTTMELVTEINGETRQKAVVKDLIFDIPTIIETLSRTMTLRPGDIIATGTPAGVGIGFTPPKYLQAGDAMTVSITGLGSLHNRVG